MGSSACCIPTRPSRRTHRLGLRAAAELVIVGQGSYGIDRFEPGEDCTFGELPVNIDELEADLPNGLHDALLHAFSKVPGERRAEFILDVWLGDLRSSVTAERERYRPARLELLDLAYLVVDETDPRYPAGNGDPLRVDACAADDDPERFRQVPPGGFAGRFFVTEWNAFIHFAALDARLTWIGAS